jgi:tetratricopeptide (TPR) repeat protein
MAKNVFISHAHDDKALADAVTELVRRVFDEHAMVSYSSDQSSGGGIQAGSQWLEWILQQIQQSDVTIVMLTPASISKPWLMWESGAVSGVSLALKEGTPIIPLLFRLDKDQVPSPLGDRQAEYGESLEGIERVLQALQASIGEPESRLMPLLLREHVPPYLEQVKLAVQDRPLPLTEDAVQEWCERLDELRAARRSREVGHLHRALLLAFTPAGPEPPPLDLRLHRRLGEMYLEVGQGAEAIKQFELALRLAPKDLFLLHKLALAHLEAVDVNGALEVLTSIEKLDADAANWSPEIAGLKGRSYRERWQSTGDVQDLRTARDAYSKAMEFSPDSYYLADNFGQLSLLLGERERAIEAFGKAEQAIARSGERSVWSLATTATAAIVRGDETHALAILGDIQALGATQRELHSIENGLRRLQHSLKVSDEMFGRWIGALRGGAEAVPPVKVEAPG